MLLARIKQVVVDARVRSNASASVPVRRLPAWDDEQQPSRHPDAALLLHAKQQPAGGGSVVKSTVLGLCRLQRSRLGV